MFFCVDNCTNADLHINTTFTIKIQYLCCFGAKSFKGGADWIVSANFPNWKSWPRELNVILRYLHWRHKWNSTLHMILQIVYKNVQVTDFEAVAIVQCSSISATVFAYRFWIFKSIAVVQNERTETQYPKHFESHRACWFTREKDAFWGPACLWAVVVYHTLGSNRW